MKKFITSAALILLLFPLVSSGQKISQGIYLSATDFNNGKISYAENPDKKYKIRLHETFNTSTIKVIIGDSIVELKKDSIFGYCDDENNFFRFYNGNIYKILNPTEKILLYTKNSFGGDRNREVIINYFFSTSSNSPIQTLSSWNIKTAFANDSSFCDLIDLYFHSDGELSDYDNFNKTYKLNHIYQTSKQAIIKK